LAPPGPGAVAGYGTRESVASGVVRLALDATPLLGARTGVAHFASGALRALAARPGTEVFGYALSSRGRTALREVLPPGVTSGWAVPARPLLWLWARSDAVTAERIVDVDEAVDVVHGTNFVVPPARHAARVVTVHDLTCVRYPEMCTRPTLRYPALIRRAVAAGAWVHTPSAFVAAEVCDVFAVAPERVRAVPHGLRVAGDEGHDATAADAGRRMAKELTGCARYVLALGTVEPRKDLPLLVRAWGMVAGGRHDVSLVIAGPDGWGADALTAAVHASPYADRIGRTGYVEGEVRAALLAGAAVLALPSVYEGFGLTPLEAMDHGVPVVATAAGAVPEVCGDAALIVPVGDDVAFADALAAVLDDSACAASLAARGPQRAAEYSWDRCADGLLALYEDARA
jgi:glycosyltransferase involved in cell wall biosynthesis